MNHGFPNHTAAPPPVRWGCVIVAALTVLLAASPRGIAQDIADDGERTTASRRRVLLIDQEGVTRPAFQLFMEGFRDGLALGGQEPVDVFVENLDLVRLGRDGRDLEQAAGWLRVKYGDQPFDVIVPTSRVSRDFVLGARDVFSPEAKVVAFGRPGEPVPELISQAWYTSIASTPQVEANIRLGVRLFPQTRRVAVIGQTKLHPTYMAAVDEEARISAERTGIEYLPWLDLGVGELLSAVRDLPPDSVVIYVGHWGDAESGAIIPAELLKTVCDESRAPVFGVVESYLGAGIVGGALTDLRSLGEQTGNLVRVACEDGPLPASAEVPLVNIFDARSLTRFGVPLSRLPAESKVLFQTPSFLERFWLQLILIGVVVAMEAGLIGALVVNLRRRMAAEKLVSTQRELVIHAARVTTLGEFAAALAHELSQPLGAILNNVEAAEMLLERDRFEADDVAELRDIVADIGSDERRAGAVLDRIRAMVRRQRFAITQVASGSLLRDVRRIAESRCLNDGIVLVVEDRELPDVAGDKILLEQALLNLVSNAIDAIGEHASPGGAGGKIVLSGCVVDDWVEFAVADNGGGFREPDPNCLREVFQTTKPEGLGMGLPIVQSIVEQHEGRVEFENEAGRGVTVRILVPLWHEGASR